MTLRRIAWADLDVAARAAWVEELRPPAPDADVAAMVGVPVGVATTVESKVRLIGASAGATVPPSVPRSAVVWNRVMAPKQLPTPHDYRFAQTFTVRLVGLSVVALALVLGGLMATARDRGVSIRYEATAGAGLPVLDTLAKLQEAGDRVDQRAGTASNDSEPAQLTMVSAPVKTSGRAA